MRVRIIVKVSTFSYGTNYIKANCTVDINCIDCGRNKYCMSLYDLSLHVDLANYTLGYSEHILCVYTVLTDTWNLK